MSTKTPFEMIQSQLRTILPSDLFDRLPKKWEKYGTVLVLQLDTSLTSFSEPIGETYAEVLHCTAVLQDLGGISGVFRIPLIRHIFGDLNTETIHCENGIQYCFDPQKIMFSSGNMDERLRMATISNSNEVVVDLFAGIGYFSLPLALYSSPKKIYSCELNPVSYEYLCKNIKLNKVGHIIQPVLGDNKNTAPKQVAHRVIMGYLKDTKQSLPTALECLHNHQGIIHYHDTCPTDQIPHLVLEEIEPVFQDHGYQSMLLQYKEIKSYAPGVSHIVLDFEVNQQ